MSVSLEAHESLPPGLQYTDSILSAGGARALRRVHAEHHESLTAFCTRTAFGLNIPSDASPEFWLCKQGGKSNSKAGGDSDDEVDEGPREQGGVSWRIRICLLVALEPPGGTSPSTHLVRSSHNGGSWATSYVARDSITPVVVRDHAPEPASDEPPPTPSSGWGSFLTSPFSLGGGSRKEMGRDVVETELSTVECEVPIRVWPGNTAFKAQDVVFDV